MGKCMNYWHGKYEHLWFNPLIMNSWILWYTRKFKDVYHIMLLGRLMQNILTRNGFKDFENIVDIWLLKYLMKLLGIKLCILNTFNLWAYDVGLPLCYDVSDYHVFMMMSLSSLWWQDRLEPFTLHDIGKSLSVWVRPLPIGPKEHMQKGYCVTCHSLLHMGEEVNPWVCGWG